MNFSSGQVNRILEEVNFKQDTKLVKCLAVHNEEGWVEYNLSNNYDEFDIIRVVEGAVTGRPGSTSDGHSTDNTLDLIRNFPDPDNKIELITADRHFKSLEEQKQTFLDYANEGEWLFIVDCDEFYLEGEVNRVRKAIEKHPKATEIIPTFFHFYRDFFHLRAPHPEWQPQHQRIIRYQPGLRYHTHPVATDGQGRCTYFTPEYQPSRYTIPNLHIFHYGHAKGEEFHKMKAEFYKKELAKYEGRGGNAATEFEIKLDEFVNYKEDLNEILYYDGVHPTAMVDHPQRHETSLHYEGLISSFLPEYAKVKDWKEDKVYSKDKLPNIVVWMEPHWGTQRMAPFYNVIEV